MRILCVGLTKVLRLLLTPRHVVRDASHHAHHFCRRLDVSHVVPLAVINAWEQRPHRHDGVNPCLQLVPEALLVGQRAELGGVLDFFANEIQRNLKEWWPCLRRYGFQILHARAHTR